MTNEELLEKFYEEPIDFKALVLACHLNYNLGEIQDFDIEKSSYDDNLFEVDRRKTKQGESPGHYRKLAADLHAALGKHDKPTWQELCASPEEVESVLNFYSEVHASEAAEKLHEKYPDFVGKFPEAMVQAKAQEMSAARRRFTYMGAYEPGYLGYKKLEKLMPQGDMHRMPNGLYTLLDNPPHANEWHIRALRLAFNGEEIEDTRKSYWDNSGEYKILTEDEADEEAKEYVEQSLWAFNASFLASQTDLPIEVFEGLSEQCEDSNDAILRIVEKTCGLDDFTKAAIAADGRGHLMSHYDGQEHEVNLTQITDWLGCFVEDDINDWMAENTEGEIVDWYYIFQIN